MNIHPSNQVSTASTDAFHKSRNEMAFAAEFHFAVKASRCFVGDLVADLKKCEDCVCEDCVWIESLPEVAGMARKAKELALAIILTTRHEMAVIEDMAVDLIADFKGKCNETRGHFHSAVWIVSFSSPTQAGHARMLS